MRRTSKVLMAATVLVAAGTNSSSISGPVDNPKMSTFATVLRLIQNAFFRAILPGFEQEVRGKA